MSNCQLSIMGNNPARLRLSASCGNSIGLNSKDRGLPGKDATINGVNTLTLNAVGVIDFTQEGDVATISSKSFVFEQGIASDVWHIEHNLNKYPAVAVVDSAGNEIISEVTYDDLNNITITMTSAFKGKAYLN